MAWAKGSAHALWMSAVRAAGHARWLWAPYLLVVGVGVACFLCSNPIVETPRYSVPPPDPDARVNLAALASGGRVRVSGYHSGRSHHPLYAIDGERDPSPTEKWASMRGDREPWIEAVLPFRADVDEVRIEMAGTRESSEFTMRAYTVRCLRGSGGRGETVAELRIVDNREDRPSHVMDCPATDRVRIAFEVEPIGSPRDVVRLYEVEAWGRRASR